MAGDESQTSLREDLQAAFDTQSNEEVETPEVETPEPEKETRERDENGRFKAKKEEEVEDKPAEASPEATEEEQQEVEEVEAEEVQEPATKPPAALKEEIKAKWAEIPKDVQEEFVRLESTQAKGMQKIAQSARFGEEMMNEVRPYEALIRAEGGTPAAAVRDLLNTAYQLRTAAPAQKATLLRQIAQQYGVDLGQVTSEEQPQLDPNLQHVMQELNSLKQQYTRQQTEHQQASQQQVMSEIEKFAADPEHTHFDSVREDMAVLIEGGRASDLKDAYDKACWANPEIRQQILSEQKTRDEAERKKAEKQAVEAKKQAGVSVKGSSTSPSTTQAEGSLRDQIAAQVYGDANRI